MGVDLSDVDRVVVWRLPGQREEAIEILWQRFGRAARSSDRTGEAILLAEEWLWGSREDQPKKPRKPRKLKLSSQSSQPI